MSTAIVSRRAAGLRRSAAFRLFDDFFVNSAYARAGDRADACDFTFGNPHDAPDPGVPPRRSEADRALDRREPDRVGRLRDGLPPRPPHRHPGRAFARHPGVDFYTIHAGAHDQVHCGRGADAATGCRQGALFADAPNVRAQLDVGAGSTAGRVDLDLTDGSLFASRGGDVDGVGHFKARNNTGAIDVAMLTSDCAGLDCRGSYAGGPVTAN